MCSLCQKWPLACGTHSIHDDGANDGDEAEGGGGGEGNHHNRLYNLLPARLHFIQISSLILTAVQESTSVLNILILQVKKLRSGEVK